MLKCRLDGDRRRLQRDVEEISIFFNAKYNLKPSENPDSIPLLAELLS
jgi:RIO-like serine/threonine protein kinase